ncbi:MAG: hypothetical protein OEZ43_05440 [Gammaproteobacteria bacterium]|nr:hypothetical protein [Gammaproteobacteria bacterium]
MFNKKQKIVTKTLMLGLALLTSSSVFADHSNSAFPGVIEPCEQLWLVNDPNNEFKDPNNGGECIDIPVSFKKAKIVFNLDNLVFNPDGSPTGLRHMFMFGSMVKHRIALGQIDPENVAIVGVIHGDALRAKWAFKNIPEGNNPVTPWIEKILQLRKDGINIQIEACGAALKGMQLNGAKLANGEPIDERAIYASENGRIYLNQGAIGRIMQLQQNGFSYFQED